MRGCLALTSVPLSGTTWVDPPGQVALDLVEQLHRLDEADDLADGDLAADLHVRCRAGGRRRVEDAGQRGLDRRWFRRARCTRRRPSLVHGRRAGRRRRRRRPQRPGRNDRGRTRADGLRRMRPVPPDSTSSSVRSDRSSRPASRSMSASRVASAIAVVGGGPDGVGRRRRRRRRCLGRRRDGAWADRLQGVLGHASHRRKTRAVFWPPNPNELLRAIRTSRRAADVRGQVQSPRRPGPGRSG